MQSESDSHDYMSMDSKGLCVLAHNAMRAAFAAHAVLSRVETVPQSGECHVHFSSQTHSLCDVLPHI